MNGPVKSILITGGAGFIGANFVCYFLNKHPQYRIINLDKLTYAGSLGNLCEIKDNPRHIFVKGDIADQSLVGSLFKDHDIRGVIHFAAESHVDNSIHDPKSFIETNIVGTFTLLEAAKKAWLMGPHAPKSGFEKCRFHHISTDEVYGELGAEGKFREDSAYAPNSPYSASKASSDFLVRSYHKTYGLNGVISNCSNNYGPKQHDEKLIPTIIRKALNHENIPIYGKGKNIRDWLYVMDHVEAIDRIYHEGQNGQSYVIGTNCEQTNLGLATVICEILDDLKPMASGSHKDLMTFVKDRPGHDFRYAIDATKLKNELGWRTTGTFQDHLRETVLWYMRKYQTRKA